MKKALLILSLFASLALAVILAERCNPLTGFIAALICFALASAALTPRSAKCFANNFGILNNTVVVADAFSLFLENLLPLRNLVLDVQDPRTGAREAKPGDTITVKDWRTELTAYQPNPTYVAQDITAADRQVTLPNIPWAVSILLTAAEYRIIASGVTGGAEYNAFRERMRQQMTYSLGTKLIDLFFAVITAANFPNATNKFVSAPGTFGRSAEVDLDTKLFTRNVPTDGAQIIGTPAFYAEWVKDHIAIQTNTGENRPKNLLMSGGTQSQNSNFTVWRTNRPMPADADRGIAMSRTGVIAAFRVPDEATYENDPVSLNTLIDPATGIPMLARLWKNGATGAIQMDLATLPVFAKGQTEAVERITAA
jgi:hypothetical protein